MMTALGRSELLRTYFACPACGQGGRPRRPAARPGWLPDPPGHPPGLPDRRPGRLRRRRRDARGVLRLGRQRRDHPPGLRGPGGPGRRVPRHPGGRRRLRRGPRRGRVPARWHHGQYRRGMAGHEGRHLRPPRARPQGHGGGVGQPEVAGADGAGGVRGDRADRACSPPGSARGPAGLELADTAAITTLGDGAAWIWGAAAGQLAGSGGVLDIYHAAGHIAEAGKKPLRREGPPRRRPSWRRAGPCCCPTAGPGCATTSGRRS